VAAPTIIDQTVSYRNCCNESRKPGLGDVAFAGTMSLRAAQIIDRSVNVLVS